MLPSAWRAPEGGADSGAFFAGQLFAGMDAPLSPVQAAVWPAFFLDRAELGGGVVWERRLEGVLRLEAIRSATPQSSFGIDRNSLLPRVRLAYAGGRHQLAVLGVDVDLRARLGVIPEPWLERLEGDTSLRSLAALPAERAGLLQTSDLGASAHISLNDGLVDVAIAVTNGEGKNEVELNAGKNVTVMAATTPARFSVCGETLALSALGAWRDGSVGVSSTRDHRGLVAVTARHPWFHVGAEGVWALGVDGRGDREVIAGGGWADAPIIPGWLGAVVRGDVVADVGGDVGANGGATSGDVLVGVFTDLGLPEVDARAPGALVRRMRVSLTGGARFAGGDAAVVDDAATQFRVLLSVELTAASDVVALPLPSTTPSEPNSP
jgi:hypothetical protein